MCSGGRCGPYASFLFFVAEFHAISVCFKLCRTMQLHMHHSYQMYNFFIPTFKFLIRKVADWFLARALPDQKF